MNIWKIKNFKEGVFEVRNPQFKNRLYFPLTNTQGRIFSWITPYLSGDIKRSVHEFLTYPATVFDIKNPFCARTLWLYFNNKDIFNLSPLWPSNDDISLESGPLWQKLIRKDKKHNLLIETLNFVPENNSAEVMRIKITNLSKKEVSFTPVTSIPLFCRSQDNLRSHRQVTSLLNRAEISPKGIKITPSMCFDERGHKKNRTSYFVYGLTNPKNRLKGVFGTLEEFTGNRGSLIRPESVFEDLTPEKHNKIHGKENFAGLKFAKQRIKPGKQTEIYLIMGISQKESMIKDFSLINTPEKIQRAFENSKQAWLNTYNSLSLNTGRKEFDFWIKWVNIQPALRKLFGCSFLADFDYGRGGKGWRDLWQDLLSLITASPKKAKPLLVNNFEGIRIDGSNATIITEKGKFISDRDKISRIWSDHGVWPFLTLKHYIDLTGDYKILFKETGFFKDRLLKRAKETAASSIPEKDFSLKDAKGKRYRSSILDHLLIENLIQFFNAGKHNNLRLEGGDWNDGLDMAKDKGESLAFSSMYANNFKELACLLQDISDRENIKEIKITKEAGILLDTLNKPVDYSSPKDKNRILNLYFERTKNKVSGQKTAVKIKGLIKDLTRKSRHITGHLRKKEWIPNPGIFNGYYDNLSRRVEGIIDKQIRIMLTSQVMAIISGTAEKKHIKKIWETACSRLRQKPFYAFRLNTDLKTLRLDLGRAFGFSYGDKENGSVFSHMNVLFAYGLYKQGFANEGNKIIQSLFKLSTNPSAEIYPCVPEYFNLENKGLYPYLTGSASWLIYSLISEVWGLKFSSGKITISPKLVKDNFRYSKKISLTVNVKGKLITLLYKNPQKKDYPDYRIVAISAEGKSIKKPQGKEIFFSEDETGRILNSKDKRIEVTLG